MKRLENGDLEVRGQVWKMIFACKGVVWVRGDWNLRHHDSWFLDWRDTNMATHWCNPIMCIDQVKLAAEHAEEL